MDRRGSEVTDTCSHCLEEREGHRQGRTLTPPGLLPGTFSARPFISYVPSERVFLQTDRVSFGREREEWRGGAGPERRRLSPQRSPGASGPLLAPALCNVLPAVTSAAKKYFPSRTPPGFFRPPTPRSGRGHPASPAGLKRALKAAGFRNRAEAKST